MNSVEKNASERKESSKIPTLTCVFMRRLLVAADLFSASYMQALYTYPDRSECPSKAGIVAFFSLKSALLR